MAADLMESFLGRHVEKIVLAAAVALFLGALGWFVIFTQSQEKLRLAVNQRVEDTKKRIKEAKIDDALSKEERVALGIDLPVLTVSGFELRLKSLGPSWDALTRWSENQPKPGGVIEPTKIVRTLPDKIMAIHDLEVAVGRGTTIEPVPNPLSKLVDAKATLYDVAWAGVVGRMDLSAQLEENTKGNAVYQPILLTKVELQRRELKPDGTWSDWQAVPPSAPKAVLAKLPKFPANPQDKRAVGEWATGVINLQADIRRMPFCPLLASDGKTVQALAGPIQGVEQPPPPPPKIEASAAPAEAAPAAPAPEAPPPPKPATGTLPPWFTQPTPPAGKPAEGAKAVTPAAVKHVVAALWAVDATVEPGKTYQYQMRPSLVNPVYSSVEAKDEKVRWTLEMTGEWSRASKEVTIPPVNEFFFVGSFGGRPNLELHRWIFGQWVIVPSAQASIGAPVVYVKPRTKITVPGGTGTKEIDVDLSPGILLVDINRNFRYRPEGNPQAIPTNVLVYADALGRLSQRIEWLDRQEANKARRSREGVLPTKGGEVVPPVRPPPPPPPPRKAPPGR